VAVGREALSAFGPSASIVHGRFSELAALAVESGFAHADLILFDFGISSTQLDAPERGFSFRAEGPLDMRMDPGSELTAARIVNQFDAGEIERILRTYGEERWARRIAQFIVARRPLRSTRDLTQAVEAAIPRNAWPRDIHPATRTFQALRIVVNDELGHLQRGLEAAVKILKPGGRLAAISFHGLEDRVVKKFGGRLSRDYEAGEPDVPELRRPRPAILRWVQRKAILPGPAELRENPRSRSAQCRVMEKL
jgi:16S rRNA (cytosine1402-N4)-methyltransferase